MGNVQIRRNSVRIRVSDGFDSKTNTRRYKTLTIHLDPDLTERQRQEEINRQKVLFEEKCRRESYIDDSMTLNSFIEQWRQDYEQSHLKNTTQKHYDDLLERIKPALGHLKLSEITPLHINAFYKNLAEEGIRIDYKYKCRIDFRKLLKDNGIDFDNFQFTKKEELLISFGRALAKDPKNIPDEIYTELKEEFTEEEIVVITAMGVLMVANNYFNDILKIEV